MTLRLRHLRLRAFTQDGPYGADFPFEPGLNVIWADNTKGKSTSMQALLYVLGMEKMLSPSREVPVPHALTNYLLRDDESQLAVTNSFVELEIENGAGTVVTVRRPIKEPGVDTRLVTVWFGPMLSVPSASAASRQFFVRDPGAFQREDGFLHFLEDFIGWDMPVVRKYDGPEGKLPLETVFPLFWVEQKRGWSTIPAAIPTYMRVRDVQKRAVEFIMDLDVHKLELQRQRLKEKLDENARNWVAVIDEMMRVTRRAGGTLSGLPSRPTIDTASLERWTVSLVQDDNAVVVETILAALRARLAALAEAKIPEVGETADALTAELEALGKDIDARNQRRLEIHKTRQLKDADIVSLERRIAQLREDLHKNQDVQRLQRYAGTAGDLTPEQCPTCEQSLVDALISQDVLEAVMPIEDNIEYVRSQLKMFGDILKREQGEQRRLEDLSAVVAGEIAQLYTRVRTIRTDLLGPSSAPSAAAVEERVRIEARIQDLEGLTASLGDTASRLHILSAEFVKLLKEGRLLPSDKMTAEDKDKLDALTGSVRELAQAFGFTTFAPKDLTIDEDSYRPQKEGYEIGFETSASDAIRLKWAYQLGLLELARNYTTNHPGMLLLDEPRQQSSSKVSFGQLLERAADHRGTGQQVIVSTSEDIDTLKPILARLLCKKIIFDGFVLQPVEAG